MLYIYLNSHDIDVQMLNIIIFHEKSLRELFYNVVNAEDVLQQQLKVKIATINLLYTVTNKQQFLRYKIEHNYS